MKSVALLLIGVGLGAVGYALLRDASPPALAQAGGEIKDITGPETLGAIKDKLPDQAHAMQDVGYHFSNLWFAGQHDHWALARFYWGETRSHLRWAVRMIPKRKDAAGKEIDLTAILQAVENTPLKQLEVSIQAQDRQAFETSYRAMLESCYACHKAADKPYLRVQVPDRPETPIINFDPSADWPK